MVSRLDGWRTVVDATLTALPLLWQAWETKDWPQMAVVIGGWMTAIGFRGAMGKLIGGKRPQKPANATPRPGGDV